MESESNLENGLYEETSTPVFLSFNGNVVYERLNRHRGDATPSTLVEGRFFMS
jgi:hypothetical protein